MFAICPRPASWLKALTSMGWSLPLAIFALAALLTDLTVWSCVSTKDERFLSLADARANGSGAFSSSAEPKVVFPKITKNIAALARKRASFNARITDHPPFRRRVQPMMALNGTAIKRAAATFWRHPLL